MPLCALLPHLMKKEQNTYSQVIISMLIESAAFIWEYIEKIQVLAKLNQGSPLVDLTILKWINRNHNDSLTIQFIQVLL